MPVGGASRRKAPTRTDMASRAPVGAIGRSEAAHLEVRIWLRLLACSTKIEKALGMRMRREFNTSLARFDLLSQLARRPEGVTMTDASKAMMVSNGAITALVDRLVSDRLVNRRANPTDKRSAMLTLTREGRNQFDHMALRHEEWLVSLLGELSRTAQTDLLQHLTLLKNRLDHHA